VSELLKGVRGFEWDEGNSGKNEPKHGVTDREAEEIFFNNSLIIGRSPKGEPEVRYAALGQTYGSRLLAVVFTIRSKRIRVISARPMSRKERKLYEEES
jgi:uncharacterized DUF497 family protein